MSHIEIFGVVRFVDVTTGDGVAFGIRITGGKIGFIAAKIVTALSRIAAKFILG